MSAIIEDIQLGPCRLICGDCLEILPTIEAVDHVITDPPYSARTHDGHDAGAREGADGMNRSALGYAHLTPEDCQIIGDLLCRSASGWIVWMSDHHLIPAISAALDSRYVFAPIPFYSPGSRVRLVGDGPSSWTIWITVARTAAQHSWGTLPGGYQSAPGWKEKSHMGGKPSRLMSALVRDYSRAGETVCDPFMGMATTGIGCIRTGRKFIGIERDPQTFADACERIARELQQQTFDL